MRKLRLWNGRWGIRQHIYVAAYSRADAVRLMEELSGYSTRGMNSEIRDYWSEDCWGRPMDGITPERGAWVFDEDTRTLTRFKAAMAEPILKRQDMDSRAPWERKP